MGRIWKSRTGRAGELWPVLLLLIVVAVPTIGVLWFAVVAMENQHLASQQQLSDYYRSRLQIARQQINADWDQLRSQASSLSFDGRKLSAFPEAVRLGIGDAVVLYDDADSVLYPHSFSLSSPTEYGPIWQEARRLENESADPLAAHELYVQIGSAATTDLERVMAIQARIRCLFKAGQHQTATELMVGLVDDNVFDSLEDVRARSISANVQLMMIEQMDPSAERERIVNSLVRCVSNYEETSIASPQRLFLMKRLADLAPGKVSPRLINAEDLAARFVAVHPTPSRDDVLRESQIPGVWQTSIPSRRIVILIEEKSLRQLVSNSALKASLPDAANIQVLRPGEEQQKTTLVSLPVSANLPGWRLSLAPGDLQQIDSTAAQRNQLYRWTGFLTVLFTSVLVVFIAGAFRRQIRLANLKNDLVGTVSHELKTPLSSMRLLVDTLLAKDRLEEDTTREYLQLIAKENTRLSRLIENFLTFTRIDQNRHVFDFCRLTPREIVDSAVESAGERFHSGDCSLDVDVASNLPDLRGDKDSLVTVLLNLLDNAYKYSTDHRKIMLAAKPTEGGVCFSVTDNGIGVSRIAKRRVFQRFFQVDQSLARDGGGCGLGLSIVDSIVKAHRGKVTIESTVGEGSTFSVTIPAMSDSLLVGEA